MAKKSREDRSSSDQGASFDNPFAKLAALKGQLPVGDGPAQSVHDDDGRASSAPRRKIVVRRERSGRGGKTVTVVEGIAPEEQRATLARDMKRALGCGATVEGDAIVLQGDLDERVAAYLEQQGHGPVVLGSRKR